MKTGFSRLCITPPLGVPIAGYYEYRETKGVLDDLYVTAVAFDDGKKKAVVIAADVIYFSFADGEKYRRLIADYCGIPIESVFVNCSHTHTGPIIGKDHISGCDSFALYDDYVGIQMRDAAAYALNNMSESKFHTATSKAEKISFIRRYRMKDGSVQTNPGVHNPNIDHALGTPNETVKLIKIERECGEDIFIVNFGTHPDTIGGEFVSADYPGFVRSTIEAAVPHTKCMFLLAPQGDVNHINPFPTKGESAGTEITFDGVPRGYAHAKHMGRVIAGAVLQICGKAEPIQADAVAFATQDITIPSNQDNSKLDEAKRIMELHESGRDAKLPYKAMELTTVVAEAKRIVTLEHGPAAYTFTLAAIRIGDIAVAGIPGEPFTELANRIYAGSPFETTVLCCLTNGGSSYFPASSAYDEGGYEARSSRLKKGGDDIVVNGMLKLLETLK